MRSKKEKEKIIWRFLENLYTKQDAEWFLRDIRDRRNDTLIDNIIWELEEESRLQKNPDTVRYEQYKQEARQLLKRFEEKRRRRFRQAAVYIAAMASVLFLVVYIFHYIKTTQISSALYTEIVTSYGEKRRLTFSDSPRVMLNSRTNIV